MSEKEELFNPKQKEFVIELITAAKDLGDHRFTLSIKKPFKIAEIQKYIRKQFKLPKTQTINIYIGEAFIPSPKEYLHDLKDKFTNGNSNLILKFSTQSIYG